jgi:hypothetical protein
MAIMKTRVGRSMVGNVSAVLGTLSQLVGATSPAASIVTCSFLTNAKTSQIKAGTLVAPRRLFQPPVVLPMSPFEPLADIGRSRPAVA